MTKRRIAALRLPDVTPAAISGQPPSVRLVSPSELHVDDSYQRGLSERSVRLIRKIVAEWDWSAFKPPICVEIEGRLEVVDGQHTAIAAVTHGNIAEIPIMVTEAAELAGRASAFVRHNRDRIQVTPTQLHSAMVAAGDEDALTIDQVCARADIRILRNPPPNSRFVPGDTVAISTIRSLVNRRHAAGARRVLDCCRATNAAPVSADLIKAVECLLFAAEYQNEIDADRIVLVVAALGNGLLGETERFATVTRARDAHGLVIPTLAPFMTYGQQGGSSRSVEEPAHTIAASIKDTNQIAAVYIAQHNGGERAPIGRVADEPLSTIMVEGSQQQAVSVYLGRQFGKSIGSDANDSTGTITAGGGGKTQVVSAHMVSMRGSDRRGYPVDRPVNAATSQGSHESVVIPFLHAYYGSEETGFSVEEAIRTATTKDRFGLTQAVAHVAPLSDAQLDQARKVAAFMRKYGCWDDREFVTLTIRGVDYIIIDIGMRMLTPRELARAQGFRESYILAAPFQGRFLTETDQRHKIGNSVCPDMAYALFRRNYRPKPRLVVDNGQGWLFAAPAQRRAAA